MKSYNVEITINYESYNGYDLRDKSNYKIEARNSKSAENKGRKLVKKDNAGRLQRGYIESVCVEEILKSTK